MKIASTNSYIQPKSNNNKSPNFTGLTSGLVNFWQFVDNGGRALQFTVEDMTGTNIPRSIKGLLAGKKYTGHINIPAFLQEAIREFLTGPTMCITPWLVLTLAKKHAGETSNTHIENIKNLSYMLDKTSVKEGEDLTDAFYNNVVKDMLSKTAEKDIPDNIVSGMVEKFKELEATKDKKAKANLFAQMQTKFEEIIKSQKDNYKDTDFLTAKYTLNETGEIGKTSFKNYAGYVTSFIEDFKKSGISKDNINSFRNSWLGKRTAVITGMIFLTGILMSQIPKIYTKASGKINPNASAIYDEADKNKGIKKADTSVKDKNTDSDNKKLKDAIAASLAAIAGLGIVFAGLKKSNPELIRPLQNKLDRITGSIQNLANRAFEGLGSKIANNNKVDKIFKYTEATGANNPFLVLVGLMVGTVILPRTITAAKRNPDNKEATLDEIKEILFRDVQTVLIILFMLKSVNSIVAGKASKVSGIPMTTKPYEKFFSDGADTLGKKIQDIISNPLGKLKILGKNILDTLHPTAGVRARTNEEFTAKYSNYKFNELSKLFEQIDNEKGDSKKVFEKIIDGTIDRCNADLNGNDKGATGILSRFRLSFNQKGKPVEALNNEKTNLEENIKALKELRVKGIEGLKEIRNEGVKTAIEDYLKDEENSLVFAGKGTNALLRAGALILEASYLGFGLPALNQKRLEKKYLKDHQNDTFDTSYSSDKSGSSLIGKNIKAHQVKLYHNFIK